MLCAQTLWCQRGHFTDMLDLLLSNHFPESQQFCEDKYKLKVSSLKIKSVWNGYTRYRNYEGGPYNHQPFKSQ